MKQVTKEIFYNRLCAETKDVIHGDCTHHVPGKYYPFTWEMKFRYSGLLFGKTVDYGYINGEPKTEYFIND